ncbi:MAG: PriCT-2 domain-containing protein, partial [Candidatus Fonsibacter sp.]
MSKKSKNYKKNDCSTRWYKFKPNNYTIGTLKHLAKDKCNNFTRVSYSLNDVFDDCNDYPVIEIDTPFLTTKREATDAMNAGQTAFKQAVHKFLNGPTKSLVLKSRYGSGKTTFMQRLINNYNPE